MKRDQSRWWLVLALLPVQWVLPIVAFTTAAEDLALLASSEAELAAAVDSELLPAASSRDYDSAENMRATFGPSAAAGYGYRPTTNNYEYGGDSAPFGASGGQGYGEDRYGAPNGIGHHEAGHRRRDRSGDEYGRQDTASGYKQQRNSGEHRPIERSFRYERDNRPQQHHVSGRYPRNEYNNERGFTYEKVYPEKVVSHSYKKDYRSPQGNNRPVEWQGGHDRSYSYSNRGAKNYTPRPVVRNYSSNYDGQTDGGHGGGRGGGHHGYQNGYGSPSVKTYDYVDPKAGSRTRLVEMVKGHGARSDVAKYIHQPGGIDRYMNNFMNGASSF